MLLTVVLEKTLESPLDCKEIKSVNPKGNQPWIFIRGTYVEAKAPIFWPPDVKNWFTGKDPDSGKDWTQEEKRTTEDEMVGWHHRLNGHEFEEAPGVSDGQGTLACYSPWGCKESDTTEGLNWVSPKLSFFDTQFFLLAESRIFSLKKIHKLFSLTLKILMCCSVLNCICCVQLCNPMDCRPPGSSVHGILQARTLEWVTMTPSRWSYKPRDTTWVSYISCIGRQVPYH